MLGMNNREVDPKSAAADLCPHVEPQVDHRLSYGLLERRLETRSVSSLLKNRRRTPRPYPIEFRSDEASKLPFFNRLRV